MSTPLPEIPAALDYAALAQELLAAETRAAAHPLVNETLCDVRAWRQDAPQEIARRLAADPLAALAALELTRAAPRIREASPSEVEFLRPFTNRDLLQCMLYFACDHEEAPELPRCHVLRKQSPWDGLLFLHLVIRWAQRFGDWRKGRRELARLNLNHPFAKALTELEPEGGDALTAQALGALGVEVIPLDPAVAEHHFPAWLLQRVGLSTSAHKPKQQTLDFRQAGGTRNSVYVVRAVGGVDGVDVRGSGGEDLALIIDIGDREMSAAATAYLEQHFARVIDEYTPLSADLLNGSLRLRWYDTRLSAEDLGQLIYKTLKSHFLLSVISVNIIFDPLRIASLRPSVLAYREERGHLLAKRTEDAAPFVVCRSCQSYAPHAFCISTADRPPCCGRSYDELATLAQLTSGMEQVATDKGICLDRARGSYLGADKQARLATEGVLSKVNLHSLRDHPHPTTAIPECIAYHLDDLDLLCILSRDYTGRGPDGKTFDTLLTRTAGKQSPGFIGVSEAYILSARFLAHEGGLSRVGWMNSALKQRLKLRVEHIATEKDCINIAGLKEYQSAWKR